MLRIACAVGVLPSFSQNVSEEDMVSFRGTFVNKHITLKLTSISDLPILYKVLINSIEFPTWHS